MTIRLKTVPLSILLLLGIFFTQNVTAQTYCASKGTAPWTEWISNVQIGTINNASQKEGYGNFTSQSTDLAKGTSYPLSITQGFSWAADPHSLRNKDGRGLITTKTAHLKTPKSLLLSQERPQRRMSPFLQPPQRAQHRCAFR